MRGRAILVGSGLGAVFAVSNLYVSLRSGWSLPVMTSAALVTARLLGPRDVAVVAAVASAAGYMAGGGNAAALPAFLMDGGTPRLALVAAFWVACALAGTWLAPLFRESAAQPFPTASATATIAANGQAGGRGLAIASAAAAALAGVRAWTRAPTTLFFPGSWRGRSLASLTFGIDTSVVLLGAGSLMQPRTALSTLLGAVITYGVIAPEGDYRAMVAFMIWPSAAMMVGASVTELVLARRVWQRARTFDVPWAALVLFAIAIVLGHIAFGASLAIVAVVPLAIVVAFVAVRSMGETDIVPTKALAPFVQLVCGAFGASATALIVAPNVTSAAALHAADAVGSIKVDRAVGSSHAIAARSAGVIVGAIAVVLAWIALVPDATALPTTELPAPAVLVWRSVAHALAGGSIDDAARRASWIAGALGIALAVLERTLPARFARLLPSAMGLGSGMVLPASNAIAIASGAIARAVYERRGGASATSIASGAIAGESLVSVGIAALLR
jgi:uncharacterized oligopeptide transporter (OPT) family protein